ncbi:ammonium transporter 2 member 5-like isoform X2 [Solanum lycopersicum]|uniref:ammonium transporter 2 member 5-like isoform X2 n=1 Tax=Solanum lycopersicum TaxID=4081 RepID=UPI003748B3BA
MAYLYLPRNHQPDDSNPQWMNKADNAWQLTSATLVGLQSVPGLVILYGSIVKKKWALNSALMALYAFAAVLVCWVGWGYQLAFGDTLVPFLGKTNFDALEQKFLTSQAFVGKFPNASMVYFQFVFAAITLILIAGALLGRMNFIAWMLFVPLWLTFSYTVGAFSIWCPQGWLFRMGVIDYSGGFVIHLSSGVAGFTAAYWVGPRAPRDRERFPPNNILLMLAGAGILWMGWTGFNGGDPYVASLDASLAVLNTHVCAAMSLLTWLMLDILFYEKPSVIGATQGMITGLVCITPAAGVVQGWAAVLMGLMSGCIPWFSMMFLHKKMWFLKQVDDTMAVFHTHAVAGTLGAILAGVLANPRLSRIFYMVDDWPKYIGLAYGIQSGKFNAGLRQLWVQLIEEEVSEGDNAVHGEEAYALWGDGEKFDNSKLQFVHEIEEHQLSKSGYGL